MKTFIKIIHWILLVVTVCLIIYASYIDFDLRWIQDKSATYILKSTWKYALVYLPMVVYFYVYGYRKLFK